MDDDVLTPDEGTGGLPTVAEILTHDVLRAAEAEVVAGHRRLDARVRGVRTTSTPEVPPQLRAGELVVTEGAGLRRRGPKDQIQYLRDCSRAGASAIVIALGPTRSGLEPAVLQAAESDGLTLIVLRGETATSEIAQQVRGEIANRKWQVQRRSTKITSTLIDLVLQGGTCGQVVNRLAELLGNPVVLADEAHQILEFASGSVDPGTLLESWNAHSRRGHRSDLPEELGALREDAELSCVWSPIVVRAQVRGRLHIMGANRPNHDLDELVLQQAAAIISLSLAADVGAGVWSERAGTALISDLLQGKLLSAEELLRRAQGAFVRLEGTRLAAVVIDPVGLTAYLDDGGLPASVRQQSGKQITAWLRAELERTGCRGVVAAYDERAFALVGLPAHARFREVLEQVAEQTAQRIAFELPGVRVVVGISREAAAETAQRAFQEAVDAAERGRYQPGERVVRHYGELDLEDLILGLGERLEVARLVESELGPVLEHDARSGVQLLPTLRAYLQHRSVQAAARALNIERRSLYHRLKTITDLLDCDLDDSDTRMMLWFALRSLDVITETGRPGRHPGWAAGGRR
ncbi:PucR family transcriptional regulator [Streptomyces sp. NPDC048282]|uniref:PucR family transcriptional regulator n=1 Tax=Streptomyces sp. NPDC048282 TaxID=3365528 RepID=UPI00371F1B40